MRAPLLCVLMVALAACTRAPGPTAPHAQAASSAAIGSAAMRAVAPVGPDGGRNPHRHAQGAPDRGELVAYPSGAQARRDGAYTWYPVEVSESHALQGIASRFMRITLPDGSVAAYAYDRHVEHPSGDWTWVGRAVGGGAADDLILTFGARAVFGSIARPGRTPLALETRHGASWLVETDPARLRLIRNPATRPTSPDYLIPPATKVSAGEGQAMLREQALAASVDTTVDVLLGYTSGFAAYHGGQSQALTRLNFLVEIANEAYRNSQVNARVRLVHAMQVEYPDATANGETLEALSGFKSGVGSIAVPAALQPLRAARDQYGADLVSLVRRFNTPENNGCGIAWLIGSGMSPVTTASARFGYSVVGDGQDAGNDGRTYFCRQETLAHEFGHNMGLQHDRDAADGDDNVLQNEEYGAFAYSFGYKTGPGAGNFYTAMAYGESGQTPYRIFSTPRVATCGGLACGVEGQADNARALGQTAPVIAAFRATVVAETPPVAPPRPVPRDLNGDGTSDLLWHNIDTGELHQYHLRSAQIVASRGGQFVPRGYRVAGVGDADANGRADILIENGQDVRLVLASGEGTLAAPVALLAYPAGWRLVGLADVDGDGRADMVWHQPDAGEVHVYTLSGAAISGGRGGYFLPAGYRIASLADFNGDGRADLLVSNGQTVGIVLAQSGPGWAAMAAVMAHPAGWTLAPPGDYSGDGSADLAWLYADSGEFHYFCMAGATATCSRGGYRLPLGQLARQAGDYNADGRTDLLSADSAQLRLSLSTSAGGFLASAPLLAQPPAGWVLAEDAVARPKGVGDVDNDGRSDMLWFNPASGELHYHLMSGAVVTGGRGGYFLPGGLQPAGVGDFDGDGRADALVVTGTDARVLLARPDGSWTLNAVAFSVPAPWGVQAVRDVNGDGRADVVLRQPATGEMHVFYMRGAQVIGGHSGFPLPADGAIRAIADLDNDGRADLVWANATEVRVSLAVSGGGFAPGVVVLARPAGWDIVAAGDIDGDQRSDLVWHNAGTGEVFVYRMSGTSVLGGGGSASVGSTQRLLSAGDYNADGRVDLLWSDGARVRMSVGMLGGFMPLQEVLAYPAGWRHLGLVLAVQTP